VVPEVVRMFTAGNGLHRVTIRLTPESLGEVRVSLSVRDGAVQVRLAASEHAQRALLEGAPELRRLLEAVGATDVKVAVRDLSGDAGSPSYSGHDRPSTGLQQQAQQHTQQHSPDHQHARTRAGDLATDGSLDGTTRSPLRRRHDPVVVPVRSTGVDVTA
jgi:flagellar hook-length control protein FliK